MVRCTLILVLLARALWSQDRIIATVAGTDVSFQDDGRQALDAAIGSPTGLDLAPDGSVYLVSGQHRQIFKIDPDGVIYLFAGNGIIGSRR